MPIRSKRPRATRPVASLADQIPDLFATSTFDAQPRDYLPEPRIKALITQAAIETELKRDQGYFEYDESERKELVDWIFTKSRKVFAITLQCDPPPSILLESMFQFQEDDFDDDSLPIKDPKSHSAVAPPLRPAGFNSTLWSDFKHYKFYKEQWTCLAPIFTPERYSYDEPSECIFPFQVDDGLPKVGAFSSVYRVRIHDDHQSNPKLREVAIKEIKVTRGNDKSGTDDAWDLEARALANINRLNHKHITKCVAAIRRGDSRYFMFPWADGDSLRDYWDSKAQQSPSAELILQTLGQLRGLADALDSLHNCNSGHSDQDDKKESNGEENLELPEIDVYDENDERTVQVVSVNKKSIRHGDLKPENILRFLNDEPGLGTLKIADMGLAKQHIVETVNRTHLTSTRYGTIRYEAPEAVTAIRGGRSRLYDVWSIGCITLEFVIWILYGNDQLNNFYNQVKGDAKQICQYFEIPETGEPKRAEIHRVVLQWINHIQNVDPECSQESAIHDLLKVVKEKLLVIPLPPNRESSVTAGRVFEPPGIGETVTRYRATADEFRDALDKILSKATSPNYLFTGKTRANVNLPLPRSSMLGLGAGRRSNGSAISTRTDAPRGPLLSGVLGRPIRADYTLPPLKDWEFPVDKLFAEALSAKLGPQAMLPQSPRIAKLCSRCSNLSFWDGGFTFEDRPAALRERAMFCDLCRMLHNVSPKEGIQAGNIITFERKLSNLIVTGDPIPVLSILRSPELEIPSPIQLGFPELPKPGTDTFYTVIRLWLEDCNSKDPRNAMHRDCHAAGEENLPTRLIDVGSLEVPILRLVETRKEEVSSKDYIALSHPWGDATKYTPFRTLREDVEAFKTAIPYDQLPATFKDAVDCTRNLKIRYLWIDSICIIQGPNGDFNEEAKRMEEVFSGAHCVLAASRASDQRDGFLGSRAQREYLTIQRGNEKPFYICKPIDKFSQDVIDGPLNKRGWVLQERALARRTIYFTENQTYFECGDGVRCETLARMRNNMANFLGDPQFPNKAMRANRAEKIAYFQGLYKQYSRLNFTRYEDRPIAIAGLEKRLQKAFGTIGGYGIFDDGDRPNGGLFHRSLLWQRGEENGDNETLTPIDFPSDRNIRVPSWSWMAYKGGIDYTDPPFESADWETKELIPPWTRGGNRDTDSAPLEGEIAILATVRDFTVAGRQPGEVELTYDTDRTRASDGQRAQCVIVAKGKEGRTENDRRHYVLLVTQKQVTTGRGEKVYERVGAGCMLGKYITLGTSGIAAKII
ncbi:Nn.00g031630.m01.CDS01 [Neocucurbitaria sp. VM-36]